MQGTVLACMAHVLRTAGPAYSLQSLQNAEGRASPAWRLLSLLLALPDLLSCATAARCSFLMTLFLRAAMALACSVPGPKLWLVPSVCRWLQWDTSALALKGMSRWRGSCKESKGLVDSAHAKKRHCLHGFTG